MGRKLRLAAAVAAVVGLPAAPPAGADGPGRSPDRPNVLLVAIDTLRADRLSAYGYGRPTSPNIDRLLAAGVRLTEGRTDEPLTGPAMCSLFTGLLPHEHGASRNGLPMRPRLPSFPKLLRRAGYRTAAFVGNWTLRDKNTGLGEHFDAYEEIFNRRRYLLFSKEATGEDLTHRALAWIGEQDRSRPWLAWVHYVEPHAPYRFHRELAPALGLPLTEPVSRADRYDTEVAFVDREVGRLRAGLEQLGLAGETLIVFLSDHGESLGEHGYWGHGRHVYDATLRVPLGFVWPGRLPAGSTLAAPALLSDLGATLLGLLGMPAVELLAGYDWSRVLTDGGAPPADRVTRHQAHRGAVLGAPAGQRSRIAGLLEVALVEDSRKEVVRVGGGARRLFDLDADPGETRSLVAADSEPSAALRAWLAEVEEGLRRAGDLPVPELDAESAEQLRALGYID